MNNKPFAEKLINWYKNNKRNLPWRNTRDPFKIWLSEVILQQTRVAQGLPYYQRFTEQFNAVEDLAAADEELILRLWQGLGYYSRARNLHRCARVVTEDFNGDFPKDYKTLVMLPGIGKYTAAAIATFAFKERVPVIDGNVYRVLSRIFGIHDDIASGPGQKTFAALASDIMSDDQPDIYNQAIMEFGAMHCTPKNPRCDDCVFNIECFARINHQQASLPVKTNKIKVKKRYFHYIVFRVDQKTAMKKRIKDDIWKGLYDYLMIEAKEFKSFDWLISQKSLRKFHPYIKNLKISRDYHHVLTHQRLYARFFTVELMAQNPLHEMFKALDLSLFNEESVYQAPKPVLISRYLNDTIF